MRIYKGAMNVIKTRRTACNIYKLLWGKIMGDVAYVGTNNDKTKLWHIHFSHLNERGMMKLYKRNFLKGVHSFTIGLYKYYVLGKLCRVRFNIRQHSTKGILDYVHYDV